MALAGNLESESMTKAVGKLEDMFRSTDSNLSSLERKIDIEYSTMFDDEDVVKDHLRNPVKMLKRVNEVKEEFSKIKEDVVEIQKLQQEALTKVKSELDKLMSSLSTLDNKVLQSESGGEVVEEERQLLKLLDHMATKSKITPSSSLEGAAAARDNADSTSS